jgi:hypothetical protein
MTTDNFCFYLQNRLIQTSQTGGQWYNDTSPFSIPWFYLHPSLVGVLITKFKVIFQAVFVRFKQYLPVPNNTKQYLTNLESVGITWYQQSIKYHRQYDSSIMKVLSRYSSDGFLSIWYHYGTDSGDFHKTFDAY